MKDTEYRRELHGFPAPRTTYLVALYEQDRKQGNITKRHDSLMADGPSLQRLYLVWVHVVDVGARLARQARHQPMSHHARRTYPFALLACPAAPSSASLPFSPSGPRRPRRVGDMLHAPGSGISF